MLLTGRLAYRKHCSVTAGAQGSNKVTLARRCRAWSGVRCCTFDNRGIGNSTIPQAYGAYRTHLMAADALALMDHLGWRRAHILGMSLGGNYIHTLFIHCAHPAPTAVSRPCQALSTIFLAQSARVAWAGPAVFWLLLQLPLW